MRILLNLIDVPTNESSADTKAIQRFGGRRVVYATSVGWVVVAGTRAAFVR